MEKLFHPSVEELLHRDETLAERIAYTDHCCSVSCSFFDRLCFGDLTCGGSSVMTVMYSSSLGLLYSSRGVPGGLRFERMLRSGGLVIVPKEMSNSKASRKGVQVPP